MKNWDINAKMKIDGWLKGSLLFKPPVNYDLCIGVASQSIVKAKVGAFNKEKALVGASSGHCENCVMSWRW